MLMWQSVWENADSTHWETDSYIISTYNVDVWNVWENVDSTCWQTDSYIISAYNVDVWSVCENEMNISQVKLNKCLSECHLWRLLWQSCDQEPWFWSEQSTHSIGRAIAIKTCCEQSTHSIGSAIAIKTCCEQSTHSIGRAIAIKTCCEQSTHSIGRATAIKTCCEQVHIALAVP